MDLFKLRGTVEVKGVPEAKKDIGDVGKTAKDTGEETTTAFGKIGKAVKAAFKNDKVNAFGQSLERLTNKTQGQQKKLDLLKNKYKDLYLQFGANSKEAKECAKEIEKLSKELKEGKTAIDKAEKAADKFDKTIDKVADSCDKAGKEMSTAFASIGGAVGVAAVAISGACVAIGGAIIGVTENTREYRREMAKLDTAFTTSGHSTESARKAYSELNSILGETDQAVEAANHLAKLTDNEKDLSTWTNICTGVYATFGASLPIEGLTEASNETAKVGKVTGSLADALNWAGVSEDAFNAQLASCSTEQERQQLIMETLNGLYSEASEEYKKANEDVIAHEKAQQRLNDVMAKFGEVGEPIITFFTDAVAGLAEKAVPVVQKLGDGFENLTTKMQNTSFEDFKTKLSNMIPESTQTIFSDFATNIGNIASKMGSGAFQTFSDNFAKIKESIETTSPFIEQLGNNYLTTLFNRFEQMGSYISGVVVPIFNFLVTALTDVGTVIWTAIAPYVTEISNKFTELSNLVTDAIDTYILPTIQAFVDMVQELWNENQDKIQKIGKLFEKVFSFIADIIGAGVEAFKDYILPFITWFVNIVQSNMGNIQSIFQAAFDYIGAIVDFFIALFEGDWKGMWEAVKSLATAAINFVKAKFTTISSFLSSIGQKIGSIAKDAFQKVYDFMTAPIRTAVTLATTLFNTLATNIKDKIDTAKTTVKNGLDAIKGFFDKLKLKLPDIKLPHFKLDGEFDLGKGKVPSIGVEWYAKGAVLNQPTAFGINPATGKVMAGGEAGAEAVAPIDVLQNYVRQAVAEANANDGTHQMIELLQQQNELLMAMLQKDTSLKIDGREFGRMVNKYA